MPFTPFHFGPAACVALPLRKRVDFLSFLLVNVAIDLEPLAAIHLNLNYPLHGYAHTFIGAVVVGILSGWALYALRRHTAKLMSFLRLDSTPSLPMVIFSGVLGGWLHVLLDSTLYPDIRPFYPLAANPLLNLISFGQMYLGCAILFLPALVLYFRSRNQVASRQDQ